MVALENGLASPFLVGALAVSLLLNIAAFVVSGPGTAFTRHSTPPVLNHGSLKSAAPSPLAVILCPQCDACPSPSSVALSPISPRRVLPPGTPRVPPSIRVNAADYIMVFQEDTLISPHNRSPFRTSFVAGPGPLSNESWAEAYASLAEVRERLPGVLAKLTGTIAENKKHEFFDRTIMGANQHYVPRSQVYVHGFGSPDDTLRCIVTSVKAGDTEWFSISRMLDALLGVRFSGLFINYRGHYPNPTGVEYRLLGVPYFMKFVLLVDSYISFGCESTMWIDSSMLPAQTLEPLFHRIEMTGAAFYSQHSDTGSQILPATREFFHVLCGTDSVDAWVHVPATGFGIQLSTLAMFRFIQRVYQFAALGTPFLSCFPEEFVQTHLLLMPEYSHLLMTPTAPIWPLWGGNSSLIHKNAYFAFTKAGGRRL